MGEKEFLPSALPNVFFFSGEKLIAVLILDRVC